MKKIFLLCLVLFPAWLSAQQADEPVPAFSFGLHAGCAVPLGEFARKDLNNLPSGFAKTGFALQIEGTYMLNAHIGFCGRFSRYSFAMDVANMKTQLGPIIPELTLKADPWSLQTVEAGVVAQGDLGKHIGLEGKIMIGDMFVYAPTVLTNTGGRRNYVEFNGANTNSLDATLALGLNVSLSRHLVFVPELSITQAEAHMQYLTPYMMNYPMRFASITGGLIWVLDNGTDTKK